MLRQTSICLKKVYIKDDCDSVLYKTARKIGWILDSMLSGIAPFGLVGRIYLLIRLSIFGGATPLKKLKQIFIVSEKLA